MINKKRRTFTSEFKTKVVLELLKGQLTTAQISSKFEVHQNQISLWKKHFMANIHHVFEDEKKKPPSKDYQHEMDDLYKKIGQLNMDLDWLKKKHERFVKQI